VGNKALLRCGYAVTVLAVTSKPDNLKSPLCLILHTNYIHTYMGTYPWRCDITDATMACHTWMQVVTELRSPMQ
jgi:hypothetical protein